MNIKEFNSKNYQEAFKKFASDELKVLIYFLEMAEQDYNIINKSIEDRFQWSKGKVKHLVDKWVEKEILEKSKHCPYCERIFEGYMPPVCDLCKTRILSEQLQFRNQKFYPRFLLKLHPKKIECLKDFIRFFNDFSENHLL